MLGREYNKVINNKEYIDKYDDFHLNKMLNVIKNSPYVNSISVNFENNTIILGTKIVIDENREESLAEHIRIANKKASHKLTISSVEENQIVLDIPDNYIF